MPTDTAFRLSLYLTLALACACVGYAEHDLFPEVPVLAAAAVVALGVLYRLERRVQLLSIPEANRLGLVLALVYFAWAAFRIARVLGSSEMMNANFQLVLVALFGPLLMTAMPAKLARREKHVGDYWTLHAAALAATALSGAMTEDPVTFVLIGLYAATAAWNLSLLYLQRAAGTVAALPNRPRTQPVTSPMGAERRWGLGRALAFTLPAAALAAVLYVLTPRSPADKLELGKPRVEIGYAADQMIDLNQTGNLSANPAPAFEVKAETDGAPKTDLNPEQRWRGRALRRYFAGTWLPGEALLPTADSAPRGVGLWSAPRLGPRRTTLTFTVPPSLPAQFLADPVLWAAGEPAPVASLTDDGPRPWFWVGDGSFYSDLRLPRGVSHTYVQVWRSDTDPDLSPPFRVVDVEAVRRFRLDELTHNPVPRVKEYADALIARMVADGRLPARYRDGATQLPRPEFHDRIARAFRTHLATSPEFTYTTNLRREQKDLDPVEEFLFHTRAGHCERFASALALLLRSQRIPALLVLGFKGCEPTEEPGRYVVRQEHAHAWVQALIVEYEPGGPGTRPISRWRSLDPTPAGEPTTADPQGGWAADARAWAGNLFRDYVTNFTAEKRRRALAAFWNRVARWEVLSAIAVLGAAVVISRRGFRRGTRDREALPAPGLYARLLAVLSSHGLAPQPGDTPREFAASVSEMLGNRAGTAAVAGVPSEWVEAYYESRFGDRPLPPERQSALEAGLQELARSLSESTRGRRGA